jgi:NAD(P)-dependent dehydrogenase (short-subunit alcohol dehydrogenase family)
MNNLFDLSGKIALITGSSSGMGKAIAEAMGEHGATIIISSNDAVECEKVAIEFSKKSIVVAAIPCDVSKKEEIDVLIKEILDELIF